MSGNLLEQYEKGLERLENADWATMEMAFRLLAINDKNELETVISLPDEDFCRRLQTDAPSC